MSMDKAKAEAIVAAYGRLEHWRGHLSHAQANNHVSVSLTDAKGYNTHQALHQSGTQLAQDIRALVIRRYEVNVANAERELRMLDCVVPEAKP